MYTRRAPTLDEKCTKRSADKRRRARLARMNHTSNRDERPSPAFFALSQRPPTRAYAEVGLRSGPHAGALRKSSNDAKLQRASSGVKPPSARGASGAFASGVS